MAEKNAAKKRKFKQKRPVANLVTVLVCLLIIGVFSALIVRQAANYNDLRAEYIRLDTELDSAIATYNALRYQMAHFDSDAYIEQLARERLGWVRPNEIVFRLRTE